MFYVRETRNGRIAGTLFVPEKIGKKVKLEVEKFSLEMASRIAEKEKIYSGDIPVLAKIIKSSVKKDLKSKKQPMVIFMGNPHLEKLEEGKSTEEIYRFGISRYSFELRQLGLGKVFSYKDLIKSFEFPVADEFFLALERQPSECIPGYKKMLDGIFLRIIYVGINVNRNSVLRDLSPKILKYGIRAPENTYFLVNTTAGKILGIGLTHEQTDEEAKKAITDTLLETGILQQEDIESAITYFMQAFNRIKKDFELNTLLLIHDTFLEIDGRQRRIISALPFPEDPIENDFKGKVNYIESYVLARDFSVLISALEEHGKATEQFAKRLGSERKF